MDPKGTVTAEAAIYGGPERYDPDDHLGQVFAGDALTLVRGDVQRDEHGFDIVYVRSEAHAGWMSLRDTSWADEQLWSGAHELREGRAERVRAPVIDPALVARLVAHPADRSAWLVLGDLLVAAGDRRGELVMLQERCAKNELLWHDGDPRLLAELQRERTLREAIAPAGPYNTVACWRYGHIMCLEVITDSPDDLARLLAHPTTRFLRELELSCDEDDLEDYVEALCELPQPAALEHLRIHADGSGDLEPLWEKVPRLARLSLEAPALRHGRLDLPALRWLELEGPRPSDDGLALGEGGLAALERISWIDAGVEELAPLLARSDLPALERATFARADDGDAVAALFSDALAATLVEIDLSEAPLSDEGARLFDDDRWARLAVLALAEEDVSDGLREALEARFEYVDWS